MGGLNFWDLVVLFSFAAAYGGLVAALFASCAIASLQHRAQCRAAGITEFSHSPPSAADPLVCQDLGSVDRLSISHRVAPPSNAPKLDPERSNVLSLQAHNHSVFPG